MVSSCVSAATEHRVHTISTIPVQLACMRSDNFTGVSQLKNNLFWAGQHTHGKKKTEGKKLWEEKKKTKTWKLHPRGCMDFSWASWWVSDPPTFQALLRKIKYPMIGDWTCELELWAWYVMMTYDGDTPGLKWLQAVSRCFRKMCFVSVAAGGAERMPPLLNCFEYVIHINPVFHSIPAILHSPVSSGLYYIYNLTCLHTSISSSPCLHCQPHTLMHAQYQP